MSDRACHMHARRLLVGLRDLGFLLHVNGSAEAARALHSAWQTVETLKMRKNAYFDSWIFKIFRGSMPRTSSRQLRLCPRAAALRLHPHSLLQLTPSASSCPPPPPLFKILDPPLLPLSLYLSLVLRSKLRSLKSDLELSHSLSWAWVFSPVLDLSPRLAHTPEAWVSSVTRRSTQTVLARHRIRYILPAVTREFSVLLGRHAKDQYSSEPSFLRVTANTLPCLVFFKCEALSGPSGTAPSAVQRANSTSLCIVRLSKSELLQGEDTQIWIVPRGS